MEKAFFETLNNARQDSTNKRVYFFIYHNKGYWLKQTEHLQGWMRLLKGNPQKALQQEIKNLQHLAQQGAAVPNLVAYGDNYLVLEDVGDTLNLWLEKTQFSPQQKMDILTDSAKALAHLHRMNLTHGRPALRDIAWQDGVVKFIDLETSSKHKNLSCRKLRDVLVFIHSLYRSKYLTQSDIEKTITEYKLASEPSIWQNVQNFMRKINWLYYFLIPFKPIAGSDLLALIGLLGYFNREV